MKTKDKAIENHVCLSAIVPTDMAEMIRAEAKGKDQSLAAFLRHVIRNYFNQKNGENI